MNRFHLPARLTHHLRLMASLVGGSIMLGFIMSTPLTPVTSPLKPAVKAAFSRTVSIPKSQSLNPPIISASGVVIIDMNTQTILFSKEPHRRLYPASLTKVMTALVALDYYDTNSIIRIDNGSLAVGAKAHLMMGDTLTAEDMLFALLIPSGNDAALTLAENYPGGYSAFLQQMNKKSEILGLVNTHFANVSGLDSYGHYTSASDMAIIAQHALDRPLIKKIVSTQKITLKSEKGFVYPLVTTNELLGKPGILGVKTGWTPEAGECLVTYSDRDDHPILISLLGSTDRFGETEKLIDWVYTNFIWE